MNEKNGLKLIVIKEPFSQVFDLIHKELNLIAAFIVVLFSVLLLSGCVNARDAAFAELIPVKHPNKDVTLSLLTDPSKISKDSSIHFLVVNRSKNRISFPVDLGARFFSIRMRT